MSAGVCIINRNGIALAADSAGTYCGNKMFYNSTNKVFSLSEKNICGAIIYSNLRIYGLSIEQMLMEFRTYLDSEPSFSDFYDILPIFRKFIELKYDYYKFRDAEREKCIELIQLLVNNWGGKIKAVINLNDAEDQIDAVIKELGEYINAGPFAPDYDVTQHIKTTYYDVFETHIDRVVPEIKSYPERMDALWCAISSYDKLALQLDEKSHTGILFAGYGTDDAFPKYLHIELSKIVGGQAKISIKEKYDSLGGSKIQPLAQVDEIYTFCKGISQVFLDSIPRSVETAINGRIDSLPASYTTDQKNEIRNALSDCKKDVLKEINQTIRTKNINPILESVALIPLPEMAFLAENLVNITTLKRTYSLDGNQQTVGGPTDVAIISKGEGFRWIKKKTV